MKYVIMGVEEFNGFVFECYDVMDFSKPTFEKALKPYKMIRVFMKGFFGAKRHMVDIFTTAGLADRRLDIFMKRGS